MNVNCHEKNEKSELINKAIILNVARLSIGWVVYVLCWILEALIQNLHDIYIDHVKTC